MTIIASTGPIADEPNPGTEQTKYEKLVDSLVRCELIAKTRHLTIGQMMDELGDASFCFICILLSIPFLQPISVGPIAMASGLTFTALGWQLWKGQPTPWLPARIRTIELSPKNWHRMIRLCLWVLRFCKKFTRRRYEGLVTGDRGRKIVAANIMIGGAMMALPLVAVPLNNMFPAFQIAFACIGELEDDGLMIFVSAFWCLFTIVYFAFIAYVIFVLGISVMDYVKRFY